MTETKQTGSDLIRELIEKNNTPKQIESRETVDSYLDKPSVFSIPSFLKKAHDIFVDFFNKSSTNDEVINDNIGKVLSAVRNLPGLHDDLRAAELDITLKDSQISDLEKQNEDLQAEVALKTELLEEIADKDYLGLMNKQLIEMSVAIRDGRDPDFAKISSEFEELKNKLQSII